MPPSQLKRLKTSLREQGIVGPQKSKKQKKQDSQGSANNEKRIQRIAALSGIRETFNPFEFKTLSRGPKFDVTSSRSGIGGDVKTGKARPGVTKGLGEETRRKTLLIEMRRRNKVGGILDRRFGENDPSMAPEDKMLERFTQEKQRRHKTSSTFDLDDDDEPGELTHMGQSLSLNGPTLADDFDEEGLTPSDAEDHPLDAENNHRKRRRESLSEGFKDEADGVDGQPARKKTKQEVMREVIAKSKLYKYERQAAKDEDEDLREELDKEMGDIHALLRGVTRQATPKTSDLAGMNPDRAALIHGTEKLKFEKDYDLRLRLLALDQKSKPTERTKTEEERLAEESRRLRELETKRLRRMQGEPEDEDEEEVDEAEARMSEEANEDQKDDFGLGTGIKPRRYASELDVEDEDDFIIDDDLVASETDFKASEDEFASDGGESTFGSDGTEFLNELLTEEESKRPDFLTGANGPIGEMESQTEKGVNGDLAYTFPCPQSHDEILEVTKGVVVQDLPTVVRRIRAIYDPRLESDNKGKLRNFTVALIDHVSYLANQLQPPPFDILENLIRHIHSLAKTYPIEVANAFRKHLVNHNDIRALTPTSGDLVLLTAINSIFPTSDHFHQVVTPAILSMARYIGQKVPHTVSDYATGLYMISLCLQYQRLSKRYVPEAMGFLLNTICALCPSRPSIIPRTFAYHESKLGRIDDAHNTHTRNLTFLDTRDLELEWQEEIILKFSLLELSIKLVDAAIDTWTGKPAFQEVFHPASTILKHLGSKTCHNKLPNSTQNLVLRTSLKLERVLLHNYKARRPLELHHHRPLAIKTSIPKFEESFNPDRYYDPDRERAEASKLRAEHKRERKGAMRELRKDSNFIARESLREKKEKDAAYEKKYKRLVAEIQGEEGKEAKAYEREKEWRRKGKR